MLGMAKKKPPSESARSGRTGKPISLWLQQDVYDALDDYLTATQPSPTKTAILEFSLKEFLRSQGFWPRAKEPREG